MSLWLWRRSSPAAGMWVFDGGPGPRNLFHIGAIDIVDLVAIALAMALTGLAVRRSWVPAPANSPPAEALDRDRRVVVSP